MPVPSRSPLFARRGLSPRRVGFPGPWSPNRQHRILECSHLTSSREMAQEPMPGQKRALSSRSQPYRSLFR